MALASYKHTVVDRFIRYAKIDTQSDPRSTTIPSTEKQKNLGRVLVEELHEIGVSDAEMDEWGYVYATIPSNTSKNVPTICFCSHMDTSPDCSGEGVEPIIHKNFDGKAFSLPKDESVIMDPERYVGLQSQVGNDLITASGDTLLGADNKAGVAEIMDLATYLMSHPEVKHGAIRILFTPDEEIGRGADKVDIDKLNAQFGYTVDGEKLGTIEDETFSADGVSIEIEGVSIHPGFAKGKLENAAKAMADVLALLPKKGLSPETTSGREGFIHPLEIYGTAEKAKSTFIIRSFVDEELTTLEEQLEGIVKQAMKNYPNSTYTFKVSEQYRNMKQVIDQNPEIVSYAEEAIQRTGLEVTKRSIRGGTDGSRLSFMGLPCPNIYAGEHDFHSKVEWTSVQDMQSAVQTLVHLVEIWEEKS